MKTYLFSKDVGQAVFEADITELLKYGETVTSIDVGQVTPISPNPLTLVITSGTDPLVKIEATGGDPNTSYGATFTVVTTARVLAFMVACTQVDPQFVPFTSNEPQAYADLVDTIQVGQSAVGTAVFAFPSDVDPVGGFVVWQFMDDQGVVYAQGNAFDYQIQSSGMSNTVLARAVINCPSSVPESDINSKYQLRYTLELPTVLPGQQRHYYSIENVTVTGLNTYPLGTQDQVEIRGKPAKMSITVDRLYDNMVIEVYRQNTLIGSIPVPEQQRVGSGFRYAATITTTNMPESLEAYTVVWNYSNRADPETVYSETANLWITTPQILTSVSDIKSRINKARTTLYGTPDLLFPTEVVMVWLRRGMDLFNGFFGVFTSFTMTNARGPVREYWLQCCEMLALTSQELAEAEKAFDFQGAAISLNVDRSAAYGAMADKIGSRLDNELKAVKQNLVIKGQTGGDGSADPSKLARGAIGSVGITITPASPWGPYRSGLPYPTVGFIS